MWKVFGKQFIEGSGQVCAIDPDFAIPISLVIIFGGKEELKIRRSL